MEKPKELWLSHVNLTKDSWWNVHVKKPLGFGDRILQENKHLEQYHVIDYSAYEKCIENFKLIRKTCFDKPVRNHIDKLLEELHEA